MRADAAALIDYLHKSPSPYHCVEQSAQALLAAGFSELDETSEPVTFRAAEGGFVRRAGTLVAWRAGTTPPAVSGFRLLGAHTDSPNLRLKPRPDLDSEGYRRWGVEVYGGVILATWLDRDLGVSGRVYVRGDDGKPTAKLLEVNRPVARIPNLAIHLNRTVNDEGLKVNAQRHLPPLLGLCAEGEKQDFKAWLKEQLGGADVLSWDLGFHDVQPPTLGGLDEEFVFSARLDNQASCFCSLAALLQAKPSSATQVTVLFDHEEIGSRSAHGAMGAFLKDILVRLERDHAEKAKGGFERAIAQSFLVSLDMAHGVHPGHADVHEPNHKPALNGGPVIKEHVEQRYATDAETSARFKLACEAEEVPYQDFVIRSDLACGSTIGPISAAGLGVKTVDVGNAMLSMHSIREQCGAKDSAMLVKVLKRVLEE